VTRGSAVALGANGDLVALGTCLERDVARVPPKGERVR
jgi:hypothetical protein